jgi:hypothetical protein
MFSRFHAEKKPGSGRIFVDIRSLFGLISYGISVMIAHQRRESLNHLTSRKEEYGSSQIRVGEYDQQPDGGLSLFKSVSTADPVLICVLYCLFFGPSERGFCKAPDAAAAWL